MKLRLGIIGLGRGWEHRHRPALLALQDRFEVRAICEEVPLKACHAAAQFNAVKVDGFRALTQRHDVDAVMLLDRQWYGALPILAACDAGKAVYCATVLDLSPGQSKQIRDQVQASGVAFMSEMPRRLAPATLRLKELIATRLGQPKLLFCHHRVLEVPGKSDRSSNLGHNGTMRNMLELIDWCRYIINQEPTSVVGVVHQEASQPNHDYQMMSLDFSAVDQPGTGSMAQISCGRYQPSHGHEAINFRAPAAMQICCENGIAFVDLPNTVIWFDQAGRHHESLESERPVGEHLLVQFHRAVTSLLCRSSSIDDAYRALQVMVTAQKSAQAGQRLTLDF